jgi:hypothetical protein
MVCCGLQAKTIKHRTESYRCFPFPSQAPDTSPFATQKSFLPNMQDSQTSANPWQDANSSIAPTQDPKTVYVMTEEIGLETFISVFSKLEATEIANNPRASRMSAYLDHLSTNYTNLPETEIQSMVSQALQRYHNETPTPEIPFNLVEKRDIPKTADKRDLENCHTEIDGAIQAMEAFSMA